MTPKFFIYDLFSQLSKIPSTQWGDFSESVEKLFTETVEDMIVDYKKEHNIELDDEDTYIPLYDVFAATYSKLSDRMSELLEIMHQGKPEDTINHRLSYEILTLQLTIILFATELITPAFCQLYNYLCFQHIDEYIEIFENSYKNFLFGN